MHKTTLLTSIIITFLILFSSPSVAQDYQSDPEVKNIRSRITDISWEISHYQYTNNLNETEISYLQFFVEMELWNPYDRDLVSYGSSSCRWISTVEFNFSTSFETENLGIACTADWAPRIYPSGISNESTISEIGFLDTHLEVVPDGTILIAPQGGTYQNETDPSYGVRIEFINGTAELHYQSIPSNWGEILVISEETNGNLELATPFAPFLIFGSIMIIIVRRIR